MRKLALTTVALVAAFAMATVAVAQTDGGYVVTASSTPSKAKGSKKKPVPIGIDFSLEAPQGDRPATIATFHVGFAHARTNGARFRTCTADSINAAGNDNRCRAAAKVGSGSVHNLAGATDDQTQKSITCNLQVTLYNGGRNRVAIYVEGNPNGRPAQCAIPVSQAIDARWVRDGSGVALEFDIPTNLQNPVPGVSNAIQTLQASFDRKTRGKGKRRVGYIESIGCRRGKRAIDAELTKADGSRIVAGTTARC